MTCSFSSQLPSTTFESPLISSPSHPNSISTPHFPPSPFILFLPASCNNGHCLELTQFSHEMMPAVGAMVDAAIGWLVQGILGNLFTEKLEAWTERIGLADDVDKLKSDMRYVQMVVAAAKGRRIENEPLAQSLADLKELLYDAEDVMDDLDYYRLKEQVQSGNTRGGTSTTTACNAATSSTWSSCSIQQHGSTFIRNLSNSISMGGSRGKRKRDDDQTIAACTHLNQSEFSRRIKDISGKLGDLARDVSDTLKIDGSNLPVASNLSQSTRVTSSFLVERKVYGRDAEVKSILELIARSRSSITVLPVVGMGGIGKTTLAQLVYNDPNVESHFQNKIWVCVSDNFDVRRVTREILDRVSETRVPETDNLDGLQEDLVKCMESKRFLIVLDDVWDDMKQGCWEKLLAPLKRIQTTGNMILVTTRKVSVAEMTQTVEPVKLSALEGCDLWQMFISCAFGDEKYEEHPSLCTIGKQITKKLRGNPLAVKTVGALLRKNISIDNWTNILNNEELKSLQDMEGIMPALKLSYDYLPDSLQQCFRYCCLFPKNYLFDAVKLVRMWISQGFVHGNHTGKKLEDIGNAYLADLVNSGFLVNLGFIKLVGRGRNYSNHFVMHDLMHDLAWEVSRTDFATIDGTKHKEILPTTRHLSIFTGFSADYEPKCGSLEKILLQLTSVRKLRSLILIGGYHLSFFTSFQHMFKKAENLRLMQVSATEAHFDCFISSLVNCTHIRYVEVDRIGSPNGVLPQALTNFFHLEVLDVDPYVGLTLPSDMSNLVSLQHLVGAGEALSTIASIGNVTALQELPVFKIQKASGFDIRQLKFMNQLVQLGIYQIENVRSKQEASEARLIDKGQLEELCLLWDSDSTSSETSTEATTEVLEVLKPHQNLKHLKISGYSGSVSPSWLEKFWFLRKLKLINICHVQEVRIPCLEELVLSGLPRLEKCMATCTRELDFYLRVLIIENCNELKVFTPFEIQNLCSSEVQQRSQMLSLKDTGSAERNKWLSGLRVLKIHGCPRLMLSHPLPPAENTQVSVQALLIYPALERMNSNDLSVMSSKELRVLNAKVLEFRNLTDVTSLHIERCPNLVFLSSEGLRQLLNLRKMAIVSCGNRVSSCIVPNADSESWKGTDHPAFPRLTHLRIESCGGIAGRWLTEMLPHMQSLEELDIEDCPQMKSISIHHPRQEAESGNLACQAVLPTSLAQDEFLLHIPLNVLSTLEKFHIQRCPEMQLCSSSREGFRGFTSLTELIITGCPMLISSANERFSVPPSVSYLCIEFLPKRLQPYFPENRSSLGFLSVRESPDLQSLRLPVARLCRSSRSRVVDRWHWRACSI
ncbi:putative disease resistance protein RGA4 isoform X1 [Sorghum bicolor]|uniref:NB-ARC domain-containing protein n=1 Tax=Sorghum bicolor TaxID=4558 RepID=A0A1Z5RF45_SORBI|nr:putative disease resistance protein RGA4 isoform X1 [Sorghum bicolor]OQU82364.1 hypothetical protein SORBI_3006G219801 [Sorghum bicolor]|eukprot:XP_002447115.2 putative disease resistance protein RGA4 isoform X1 [Sorghum bicolor]